MTDTEILDEYVAFPSAFCARCLLRVRSAGHWKERRALAREARIGALVERYPSLFIGLRTWPRVVLVGVIEGREVRITLRISARERERERYVLKVELKEQRESIAGRGLGLPYHVAQSLAGPPSIVVDQFRHVRAGFAHLGKLDIVYALEAMLTATRAFDEEVLAVRRG